MTANAYETDKILRHPKALRRIALGRGHRINPIVVHLMPQNTCNQSCSFCSYRLPDWKNSKLFDESKHIPWDKMEELVKDLQVLRTRAVEITGGGEPLAYPYAKEMFRLLADTPLETALVTNGTLLTDEMADAFQSTEWKWARVSIDAGTSATYEKIRHVSKTHHEKAWAAVKRLVARKEEDDQRVGVGFVVVPENTHEVFDACVQAKEAGADNIRVSVAFVKAGATLLDAETVESVKLQIDRAQRSLNGECFTVVDLFAERLRNLRDSPVQDYDYCGTKDVLCVIEGECNVYTCCTLAGDPRGLVGNIREQKLQDLWFATREFRRTFDVRERCQCVCLYEKRNRTFLELRKPLLHENFI